MRSSPVLLINSMLSAELPASLICSDLCLRLRRQLTADWFIIIKAIQLKDVKTLTSKQLTVRAPLLTSSSLEGCCDGIVAAASMCHISYTLQLTFAMSMKHTGFSCSDCSSCVIRSQRANAETKMTHVNTSEVSIASVSIVSTRTVPASFLDRRKISAPNIFFLQMIRIIEVLRPKIQLISVFIEHKSINVRKNTYCTQFS